SVLFAPGHKADWIQKALASDADAIIIDLEDAVPREAKQAARENARDAIRGYTGSTRILVRPNGLETEHFADDVRVASVDGLAAYLLPMLRTRDDVVAFDAVIAAGEIANGVERGSIDVVASFETAESVEHAHEILGGPRVAGAMGAAAKDADIARSVGFRWTAEGSETL